MLKLCSALLATAAALSGAEIRMGGEQPNTRSARELIAFLAYQCCGRDASKAGTSSCNTEDPDRIAAENLTALGASAIQDLELALDSVETRGESSEYYMGAHSLLVVFARSRSAAAVPRLERMRIDRKLADLRWSLDVALAESLGLTSFVSDSHNPARVFNCWRAADPRDALDLLILAWEMDERQWFEAALGPNGRSGLEAFRTTKTWAAARAELWRPRHRHGAGLGYKFDIVGPWARADTGLRDHHSQWDSSLFDRAGFELDTVFTDRSGEPCGKYRLRFSEPGVEGARAPAYLHYVVENSDLEGLLRVVGACVSGDGVR